MFLRLAVLFVAVPMVELSLLLWIGRHVGVLPTIALIFTTGVLGAALARSQGLRTWRRFQLAVHAGRTPHRELVDGLLILVAGAVLLTPGLLTDLAGFVLLVPPARRRIATVLGRRLARNLRLVTPARGPRTGGGGGGADDDVVDVDFDVVEGEAEDAGGDRRRP